MRTVVRGMGWRDACLYLIGQTLVRLTHGHVRLHKYVFIAQPVSSVPFLRAVRANRIIVRELYAGDPLIEQLPRPLSATRFRFGQGAVCLAAFRGQMCVGFLWLRLGEYEEDEVKCRYIPLPEGKSAWDFDVYVHPEHRTGIVFLRLWDEANRYLASRGVRWSLSRISAFNPGSIAAHGRLGARRIGSALFLTVGTRQVSIASVPPRVFITRGMTSRPIFGLRAVQ